MEQFELFKDKDRELLVEAQEKKGKEPKLPDARGYNVIGGFAEKVIRETRKEHTCRICGNVIPTGSPAREIIEVVNDKLLVRSKEYAHLKGQCPPIAKE